MLGLALSAYLAIGQAVDARPPRPTDEQMLAAVAAEVPTGRILSSEFGRMPEGYGWVGCGLIEVDGAVEPFSVYPMWQEARPEQHTVSGISIRGPDGQWVTTAVPPTPAQPAHWTTNISVPRHADLEGDGRDRHDRNRDTLDRIMALSFCKTLSPPEGVVWTREVEPNPDRAAQARAEERARQITDAIFGVAPAAH